ncbi:MAG: hypothetical protein ABH854_01500 [Candidatus Diapherotrites archaeon]
MEKGKRKITFAKLKKMIETARKDPEIMGAIRAHYKAHTGRTLN